MNEIDDYETALAIATKEPKHLGQPTTPPLSWQRNAITGWMTVVLADGRKICRPTPQPNSLLPESTPKRGRFAKEPIDPIGEVKQHPSPQTGNSSKNSHHRQPSANAQPRQATQKGKRK